VIGGGPAGAAFACGSRGSANDVVLIERSAFTRPRVGEAMAPSNMDVLDVWKSRRSRQGGFFFFFPFFFFMRIEQSILDGVASTRICRSSCGPLSG